MHVVEKQKRHRTKTWKWAHIHSYSHSQTPNPGKGGTRWSLPGWGPRALFSSPHLHFPLVPGTEAPPQGLLGFSLPPPFSLGGSLGPLEPPRFHSFVPTPDSGPQSVVHRQCLQVLNDSGGNEDKWPLNPVLEENPRKKSKLSFYLTER